MARLRIYRKQWYAERARDGIRPHRRGADAIIRHARLYPVVCGRAAAGERAAQENGR